MTPDRIRKSHSLLLAVIAALPLCANALPEDDQQQVVFGDSASIDISLSEGEVVQKAHPGESTCVTQGSRVICGAEIRLKRAANGKVERVTATGTPASFQQQPEADQEIVKFSGRTLVFDQAAQLVTIDGDGKFSQGCNELSQEHIEYHLDTRTINASGGRGSMSLTPAESCN